MIAVTVVVPTFRRPELLQKCLVALDAQTLDAARYEVVIADDAASAETERQVRTFAATASVPVRYIPVHGAHGPAAARNVGWRAAQAPLIAFTDDDCLPQPEWLERALEVLERDPGLAAVSGRIVVPVSAPPTDFEVDTAGLETSEFVTANCVCRRLVLEVIGGFDEQFTTAWREDSDLQFRILSHGGRVGQVGDAVVVHPVREAPWGVSLRMQRKVQFDALLYKKHPTLYRERIRPGTPWNYYAMTIAWIGALLFGVGGWNVALGIALVIWLTLLIAFLWRRLHGRSWAPAHVAEMVVTSIAIPMLSVYWRLYGAWRFRVFFV